MNRPNKTCGCIPLHKIRMPNYIGWTDNRTQNERVSRGRHIVSYI